MHQRQACVASLLVALATMIAGPHGPAASEPESPALPDKSEPLALVFSTARAAEAMDTAGIEWVQTRKCAACHTVPPYLMARAYLSKVKPAPGDVREFVEHVVRDRTEGEPQLPKDGISAVLVQVAVSLAVNDRQTTGRLSSVTREALDRMWTVQRPDGSWEWPFRDVPPIKMDEHYGVTLAAIGVGMAPDDYALTPAAKQGLEAIRRYLRAHPPESLHQQGMLVWAARYVDDILLPTERIQLVECLLAAQSADGGWSLAQLVDNTAHAPDAEKLLKPFQAETGFGTEFRVYIGRGQAYKSSLASDGYATGFAIFVSRQAGIPANDARLIRGIDWLRKNQRESGRWFTPSQGNHTRNYISNAGTAFAVMALGECGAIGAPQ